MAPLVLPASLRGLWDLGTGFRGPVHLCSSVALEELLPVPLTRPHTIAHVASSSRLCVVSPLCTQRLVSLAFVHLSLGLGAPGPWVQVCRDGHLQVRTSRPRQVRPEATWPAGNLRNEPTADLLGCSVNIPPGSAPTDEGHRSKGSWECVHACSSPGP